MARTLIVSDRHNSFFSANNIRVGNQIPTEGNYVKGDIIVNIGDNTASEAMWICVESGNPGIWEVVGAGAGGGSFVSINDSVFVNEPVNEVSLAGLGVGVSSKDKLIVHHNSIHLMEGVDYEISEDGTKIVKLTEGNWNEDSEEAMFAFELFKNVESVDGDKIVVDSKMTSITNHVVIENACSEVEIGIEGFNAGNDMMLVFKNGVNMVEGVDYGVQDGKIVSTGEVWNENGLEDYGMTFVVFKEVVEYNGDAEVKAENIADGSIGMDKLADDVKEAIENASNIDLSGYQSKEDEELVTNNKTVIGAINELFQNANNGKQLIANAIGEPVSSEDTFQAMSSDINGLLSTFKTNMMNNGVTVESSDKFKSLIDKIATMVEDGSGKGIQFAEGVSNIGKLTYGYYGNIYTINANIGFKPSYLFAVLSECPSYGNGSYNTTISSFEETGDSASYIMYISSMDETSFNIFMKGPQSYTTDNAVDIHWYAIGVGEEDTTLRDSLASILQEEGVSVTEEDDMASLISKVDEEFDRQVVPTGDAVASNVLTGKTFINSTGQVVTGTMANMSTHTQVADYVAWNEYSIYLGIPTGAYVNTSSTGYPEVYIEKTRLDSNLVPENIVSGKSICGVTGSAPASSYVSGSDSAYKSTPGRQIVERVTIQTNLGFVPSNLIVMFKSNSSYGYEMQYFTVCSAFNKNKGTGVYFHSGIQAWFYIENVNANSFDIVSEVSSQNYRMNYSEIKWMAYK